MAVWGWGAQGQPLGRWPWAGPSARDRGSQSWGPPGGDRGRPQGRAEGSAERLERGHGETGPGRGPAAGSAHTGPGARPAPSGGRVASGLGDGRPSARAWPRPLPSGAAQQWATYRLTANGCAGHEQSEALAALRPTGNRNGPLPSNGRNCRGTSARPRAFQNLLLRTCAASTAQRAGRPPSPTAAEGSWAGAFKTPPNKPRP